MTNQSDLEYYASRAVAERELSEGTADLVAASIHAKLADCYEKLARDAAPPRRVLRIVTASPPDRLSA
jgi:hypothetical protein